MKNISETERLIIRHFAHSDLTALMDLLSDAEAMRFIGPRRAMSLDEGQDWLSKQLELQEHTFTRFVVAVKHTNELIGICGVQQMGGVLDFGCFFRRKFWGQGFAFEACQQVLGYLADDALKSDFVVFVARENISSQGLLAKLGFQLGDLTMRNNEEGYFCKRSHSHV